MSEKRREIKKLKQFNLESKEAHIEYLYEIITRSYMLTRRLKKYLNELEIEIDILREQSAKWIVYT